VTQGQRWVAYQADALQCEAGGKPIAADARDRDVHPILHR